MPKLLYVILELEEWNNRGTCYFCSNKAVCQIRTRNEITEKLVANDKACESCREKLDNNELPKCERCGRLQTKSDLDFASNKYICDCIRYNENIDEKELPVLPVERRQTAFYERQINGLREELNTAEVEIDTHLEALEISEVWNKRQKEELLDEIKKLREEVERLKEENKKLASEELAQKVEKYEKEITELKEQVKKSSKQQVAQIEVPLKENKIKNLFKFGGSK